MKKKEAKSRKAKVALKDLKPKKKVKGGISGQGSGDPIPTESISFNRK